MGDRGLRALREGVACVLARLSRSHSLSFGTAVASEDDDALEGDAVSLEVVAAMVACLRCMDPADQVSAAPLRLRPPSLRRASAGDTRGYLRV
jgi:hypothetical protein